MTAKRNLLLLTLAVFAMFFFVAAVNAEEEGQSDAGEAAATAAGAGSPSDVIEMKNSEMFEQHKMGIVVFEHKKHHDPKPDGHAAGCGECHHDANGEPLADLKPGDPVEKCTDCHSEPGKPKREPGVSPEDWKTAQLEYYYGAIHENCVECHKEQGGPVKCTECHPKPEK